ncbi:MAG: hypothetical protein LBK56_11485 [Gracilibacteraceae bacterium]|jgi:hypothetical protein|nr:hypothetical protein [Gracilibacteraceae bacterium]
MFTRKGIRARCCLSLLLALALLAIMPLPVVWAGQTPGEDGAAPEQPEGVYETEDDTFRAEMRAAAAGVYVPGADTAALAEAITEAQARYGDAEASAEATSLAALGTAVAAAEAAIQSEGLTQKEADAQVALLKAAQAALVLSEDLQNRQALPAGDHPFAQRTALWNYSVPANPSMGHAAVAHELSRVISGPDGKAELRLFFQPLSTAGLTGYLETFARVDRIYYDDGGYISHYDKTPAAVYETYEGFTDAHGPIHQGLWYPRELGIPVSPGEEEVIVEVFVPVMEKINSGSGTQLARLRLDWSGVDLSGGAQRADVADLEAALAEAGGSGAAGWTAASRAALSAATAAGEWLVSRNAALTVTQDMADKRAAAVRAALSALLPAAATPVNPGTPGTGGGAGAVDPAQDGRYYVNVDLWHAELNKSSMGSVAFDKTALVITEGGSSVMHIATHPVEVSGYTTGITEVEGASELVSAPFTTNTKFDGEEHEIIYLKVFEISLPDVSAEYLPTRIKVPYTPMDAVGAATDGWLEARFRINWASVKTAPADAELNPTENVAYGNSSLSPSKAPTAALRDETTNIRLTAPAGVVPEGAVFVVAQIGAESASTGYQLAQRALTEIGDKFTLFDISLELEGEAIQPDGLITLRIPIPAGYDPESVLCYRVNADGTATLIRGRISEDFYEVDLNHLSLYALVAGAAKVPPPPVPPPAAATVTAPAAAAAPEPAVVRADAPAAAEPVRVQTETEAAAEETVPEAAPVVARAAEPAAAATAPVVNEQAPKQSAGLQAAAIGALALAAVAAGFIIRRRRAKPGA